MVLLKILAHVNIFQANFALATVVHNIFINLKFQKVFMLPSLKQTISDGPVKLSHARYIKVFSLKSEQAGVISPSTDVQNCISKF